MNLSHEINVIFILYYSDFELRDIDFIEGKRKKIILLSPKHKDFYQDITLKLKEKSKEIIFSDLLVNKKWPIRDDKPFKISALRGKNSDGLTIYYFLAKPTILKKICYVNRRNMQFSLNEDEIKYQRIIDAKRIKDIQSFLLNGGFFPNSVLLNFDKEVTFLPGEKNRLDSSKNIDHGYIQIPKEYGYAWIIDGQHRIFGYSGLDELSEEHYLNVIALNNISPTRQARLYVEINENQKKIDKVDIWDLYTQLEDINSENYILSWLVKELNIKNKYLKNNIYIPSLSKLGKNHYPINIHNIASSIKKCKKIINKLCLKNNFINKERLFSIINTYLNFFYNADESKFKERSNFYLSNNGIAILIYVLDHFYDFIKEKKVDWDISPNRLLDLLEEYSSFIADVINKSDVTQLSGYIKQSSESSRVNNKFEIIEKASRYSEIFRKINNQSYLTRIGEDSNNEFKETLLYIAKDKKINKEMFIENILGTICAYINAGIEGNLYIGIDDLGKQKGIEEELRICFHDNFDEMLRFINNELKSRLLIKDFSLDFIDISKFIETPLILCIKVSLPLTSEGIEDAACIIKPIKNGDQPLVYLKRKNEKLNIKSSYKDQITNERKIENLSNLLLDYYQNK